MELMEILNFRQFGDENIDDFFHLSLKLERNLGKYRTKPVSLYFTPTKTIYLARTSFCA